MPVTNKMIYPMCDHRIHRPAWTPTQSDPSLCALYAELKLQNLYMDSAKTHISGESRQTSRLTRVIAFEPWHEIFNNVVCATSKGSDQPAHTRRLIRAFARSFKYCITVKLLTAHHLEFLGLKGGCTGSSESTLAKMPHCWKSHATACLF